MRIIVLSFLAIAYQTIPALAADPILLDVKPDGTLSSLTAARDLIRQHRAKGEWKTEPIRVNIHPGRYVLTEPFVLTAQDSGVTYIAFNDQSPIITGGNTITWWEEKKIDGKTVWKAEIPEVKSKQWFFRELFVNGQRRARTRLPQSGYYHFAGLPTTKPETSWGEGQSEAVFAPGDLKNWKNLPDVEITALVKWIETHLPLAAVDETSRRVKFGKTSTFLLIDGSEFSRYYVENVPELHLPGQWYLDSNEGTLYYMPMPGETLDSVEAVATRLPQLVVIGEPNGPPVSDVVLQGLTFQHAEWTLPKESAGGSQAAVNVPGAIFLQQAKNCMVRQCRIEHVGTYAVELGAGCENNAIDNNVLTDLGAGGIKVGHDSAGTKVTNNEIGPGGLIFHSAIGVWVGNSGHNLIAHNHIHHLYYTGISVGWTWGYGDSKAVENIIEYNNVHDIGQGMLSDMGGIYTLGPSPGTIIRNNLFHDIRAYNYGGWGIYNDEGSTGILVENNIVYNTTHGGYHQHYGKENIIRNNIFAFGKAAQVVRSREEDHLSFTFEHNLVYFSEGPLLGTTWSNGHFKLDNNCYYRTDGKPIDFAGSTFEQWQAKGQDAHSIVADPLFESASGGDFTLKPGSPAFRIGFKPIDTSHNGRQ